MTFAGTTQTGHTYSTTGLSSGALLVVAQQVSTAVTTSGRYTYCQGSFESDPLAII